MYTKATKSTTRTRIGVPQRQSVSNPIHRDMPKFAGDIEQQSLRYRIANGIMFFGLAAVAITIFYKALMSLML